MDETKALVAGTGLFIGLVLWLLFDLYGGGAAALGLLLALLGATLMLAVGVRVEDGGPR